MIKNGLWTSESVTEGHPDKVCDYISDSILDACLEQDKYSRVAVETGVKSRRAKKGKMKGKYFHRVFLIGEVTTQAKIDYDAVARQALCELGYDADAKGMNYKTASIDVFISEQSPDISLGVTATAEKDQGAGDQGMMVGYAIDHTDEFMPLPIVLAHALTKRLTDYRKSREGVGRFLRPDGKSQVTVEFQNYNPQRIEALVLSAHHSKKILLDDLEHALHTDVLQPFFPEGVDTDTKIFINPTGRFETGGPLGDSGVTGRKIIVDTYGGWARHGGGAFSGKDPSKVDRSAAYAARWVAKNVVAAGLAHACEVQVAYAIGVARPVSVCVDTSGTGKVADEDIAKAITACFDLRPRAIIEQLDLLRPIYRQTTNYGHFGKPELPWEKTGKVGELRRAVGK